MTSRRHPTSGSTRRTVVGALAAAPVALAFPAIVRAQAAPVKVGYAIARTGPWAGGAQVSQEPNFLLWAEQQNAAGGLNVKGTRRPIELVSSDDRSDIETCVRTYEKLMGSDKVDLVLPPWGSNANFAVAPIANRMGYPFLAPTALSRRLVRERGAGGDRPGVERPSPAAAFLDADRDRREQLFPDPRHAEEHRRRDLAQVFLHGADRFAEVDPRAEIERHEHRQHLLGDVAERQVRKVAGRGHQPQPVDDAGGHRGDVAVADHRPLGLAGGAGGVDDERGVGEGLALQHRLDRRPALAFGGGAERLELVEADHQLRCAGAGVGEALPFHDDDPAQPRQPVARLEHLVALLLVLADDDLGVGMLEDVGDLDRRAGGIDADRDRAHQPGAELRQYPFDPVLRQHADVPALAQPGGAKAEADPDRTAVIVGPGQRLPDAVLLLPEGDARRFVARLPGQGLRQRQLGGEAGHGGTHGRLTTASACGACSA